MIERDATHPEVIREWTGQAPQAARPDFRGLVCFKPRRAFAPLVFFVAGAAFVLAFIVAG